MRIATALFPLFMSGCSTASDGPVKAIVGATLIDGSGKPAWQHSIILVSGGKIQAVGPQSSVPVPRSSVKINALGKFVMPVSAGMTLSAGQPADLLLVGADPARDPDYLSKVECRMIAGQWQAPAQ